jgi:D-serine deaminase-like pyridoxal phosphate-dependent protein
MDALFPAPSRDDLHHYLNLPLSSLPTPSAILHLPTVTRNCARLVSTTQSTLGIRFRPHTKTHKTLELTRLQLSGLDHGDVIVSTVREAEALEPLVREGVVTGILYGLPLPPSAVPRLSALRERNPALDVTVLVDHPSQLPGAGWGVFVKLDNGYHRAGLPPESAQLQTLLKAIAASGAELRGFYSHAGHSYSSSSATESLRFLADELDAVITAATFLGDSGKELILSVGATPTALAAEGMEETVQHIRECGWMLELHAGVYTLLDLQQLSTNPAGVGRGDIAITVLAEVASVYPERGEALLALGTTGLGREPGKIVGWGVVTGWQEGKEWDGERKSGWVVGRISQEHAVLTKEGDGDAMELRVGMKVRVWPQHACIAGHAHGWYFVTDGEKVLDVWVRCRGW